MNNDALELAMKIQKRKGRLVNMIRMAENIYLDSLKGEDSIADEIIKQVIDDKEKRIFF